MIAIAIFLILAALPRSAPPQPLAQLPELIRAYDFVDSSRQRQAHRVVVALLALGVLCAGWLSRRPRPDLFRFDCAVPGLLGVAVLALPVLAWLLGLRFVLPAVFFVLTLTVLSLSALALTERLRLTRHVFAAVCAVYLALIAIPGYIGPVLLLTEIPYHIAQLELHLAQMIQPSSILAAGFRLFDDITPSYGILVPTLTGIFERHFGFLDVAGQVRLVQLSQIVFLILAVIVYCRVRGRLLPALLPLVMVGPFLTTAGLAIWHPNQSGIRHLVFPLGLLVLQSTGAVTPNRQAVLLGFTGAWLLMFNLETGIAVLCGYAFYLYLQVQQPRVRQLGFMLAWAVLGALVAGAMFCLVYRVGLGSWLTLPGLLKGVRTFLERLPGDFSGSLLFAAGPQNLNLVYVPLALVMFFHGLYLVVLSALRARRRPLTERELFVAASAVILIVWSGYYFSFASWWNLWIPIFLYGVIAAAQFDTRRIRLALARPARIARNPWGALTIMLMLMVCAASHRDFAEFNRNQLAPNWRSTDTGVMVSGVVVPTNLAGPLAEKAAFLEKAARTGRVAYSTLNNDFMPVLSRVYQSGMQRNFWSLAHSETEIRRTIAEVARSRPDRFLIDAVDGPLAMFGARRSHQERIQRIVAEHFDLVERTAGWEVWVPKKP